MALGSRQQRSYFGSADNGKASPSNGCQKLEHGRRKKKGLTIKKIESRRGKDDNQIESDHRKGKLYSTTT